MADKEMRAVLAEGLTAMMQANENIVVIDADLARANGTLALHNIFPDRAFDVGIAEQNMASVAAGMASYGFIPFIGSFCPFATRRICDQIAISISYTKSNVKIIGTDPGATAEVNGGTHMSVEDIGVIRSIPGIVIFEPVDNVQLAAALPQIVDYNGPVYLRLFRKVIANVFDPANFQFDLFGSNTIKEGEDVTVFASGIMVHESLKAVQELEKQGVSAELINIHTIKPIDAKTIVASAKKTRAVVTAENHNVVGGLGSAVAEVLSRECPTVQSYVGIPDRFGEVGMLPYLLETFGMTSEHIVAAALDAIANK